MLDSATPIADDAADDAYRARWQSAARRARWLWSLSTACHECGEWVGHRGACGFIPLNVPLEEVRPGCVAVRRRWIGDSIRAVCKS